jgi:hypothetical protein
MAENFPIQVLFDSEEEREKMHKKALDHGFVSTSAFLKFCGINSRISIEIGKYPVVKNLETLKGLYDSGFISDRQLQSVLQQVIDGDAKPMISLAKMAKN